MNKYSLYFFLLFFQNCPCISVSMPVVCLSVCQFLFISVCVFVCLFFSFSLYFVCLCSCMSVCLFVPLVAYLSVSLSVYLSVYYFVCLSTCLSVCPFVCLSICLSICLSVYLSDFLFVYLSICCLSICLFVYLSICLSRRLIDLFFVCLSVCLQYFTWISFIVHLNFSLWNVNSGLCEHTRIFTAEELKSVLSTRESVLGNQYSRIVWWASWCSWVSSRLRLICRRTYWRPNAASTSLTSTQSQNVQQEL